MKMILAWIGFFTAISEGLLENVGKPNDTENHEFEISQIRENWTTLVAEHSPGLVQDRNSTVDEGADTNTDSRGLPLLNVDSKATRQDDKHMGRSDVYPDLGKNRGLVNLGHPEKRQILQRNSSNVNHLVHPHDTGETTDLEHDTDAAETQLRKHDGQGGRSTLENPGQGEKTRVKHSDKGQKVRLMHQDLDDKFLISHPGKVHMFDINQYESGNNFDIMDHKPGNTVDKNRLKSGNSFDIKQVQTGNTFRMKHTEENDEAQLRSLHASDKSTVKKSGPGVKHDLTHADQDGKVRFKLSEHGPPNLFTRQSHIGQRKWSQLNKLFKEHLRQQENEFMQINRKLHDLLTHEEVPKMFGDVMSLIDGTFKNLFSSQTASQELNSLANPTDERRFVGDKKDEREHETNRIYQVNGNSFENGNIRDEENIVKVEQGPKEVNWVIKIKQVLVDDNNSNKRKRKIKLGDNNVNLAEDVAEDEMSKRKNDEHVSGLVRGERVSSRHLMGYRGREKREANRIPAESMKNRNEARSEHSDSSAEEDSESDLPSGSDSGSAVTAIKNALKNLSGKEAQMSELNDDFKKRLGNNDLAFLLKQDLQNEGENPYYMHLATNGKAKEKKLSQIDDILERLQNPYKYDFDKGNKESREKDDGRNSEEDGENDGKINDLIKDGEEDEKNVEQSQDSRMKKRSVQDVTGYYGAAVDDDDEDNNRPNEYDVETENGVTEERLPRAVRQRRMRRSQKSEHSTQSNHEPTTSSHQESTTNRITVEEKNANQHIEKFASPNGAGKMIGVLVIPLSDATMKEGEFTKHGEQHHHGHNAHQRKLCNTSHSGHANGKHPCHHGHWKHHHSPHHVVGHHANQQRHDLDTGVQSSHHEGQGDHSGYQIHNGDHGKVQESEMSVGSYSNDVGGVVRSHGHSPPQHAGSAVHVLVILSIFLIFFTVILFVIVKNRTSSHIREINSRTALYVPQAKY